MEIFDNMKDKIEKEVKTADDYVEENPKTGNPDVLMLIIPAIMSGAAIVSKKFTK